MRTRDRLQRALRVRPGEGRLVAIVLAYGFTLGLGRALCATALSGLFLSVFGARAMPYVFLGTAVAVPVTGLSYLRLQARLPLPHLIAGTLVLLAAALAGLRAAFGLGAPPWLVMAAMIGYTVLHVLVTLAFWGLNGQIFDLGQAKRLFGLLGSGSELADVAGGVLTLLLVPLLGSPNLLLLGAGALLCALLAQRALVARATLAGAGGAGAEDADAGGPAALLRSRYVRLIFGLLALSQLGYFFVDNIFYELSMAHFAGAEQFAALVGGTLAATSALTLLFQVAIAGPLIGRFGVAAGQLALPLTVLAGALAVAVAGTLAGGALAVFGLMLATRVGERALRFSVDESSVQIAYQPLPAAQRSLAQTLVEGGVKPLAAGVAGAALLVCTRLLGLGAVDLAYLLVAIAAAWSALAVALGRAYRGALVAALSGRRVAVAQLDLSDGTSHAVLRSSLRSPHAGEALYALELLEAAGSPELAAGLETVLAHPEALVRQEVLRHVERLRPAALAPAVAALAERDPDPAARAAALRALSALDAGRAGALARPALAAADPELRLAAFVALARGSAHGRLDAWLAEHARAADPATRLLAARALGEGGRHAPPELLRALLADPDAEVRRAALAAIPRAGAPELWPATVAALGDPGLRGAAALALAAGGESALPALRAALGDPGAGELRLHAARVCGKIGGPAAGPLLGLIDAPDEELRHAALAALEHCGWRAEGAAAARAGAQALAEAADAAWLLAARRDLGAGEAAAPLRAAIDRALARCRERALALIGLQHGHAVVAQVRAGLDHSSRERRAYALEALELLLAPGLRAAVLPLADLGDPAAALAALERTFPQPAAPPAERLAQLLAADPRRLHPWLRACARYTAGWLGAAGQPAGDGALVERALLLKATPLFAMVPEEELFVVAALLRPEQFGAGAPVFVKGEPGACAYIIARGGVRVHDGERTIGELGARDAFGEVAVLDGRPRTASATAIEPSELLRLDRAVLDELVVRHSGVAHGIIRALIRYLRVNVRELHALDMQLQGLRGAPPRGG